MTAFANLDQLLASYPASTRPDVTDETRARMADVLEQVTDALIEEIGYDFRPWEGEDSAVWILDAPNSTRLHVHSGVQSIASIAIKTSATADWETIGDDDAALVAFYSDRQYDHIDLTGVGRTRWPAGRRRIRLTGRPGLTRVPRTAVEATVAWARQQISSDSSYTGGIPGPDGFSQALAMNRAPEVVFRFLERERRRYMACST
jgi:hypothetical protein